MNLGDEPYKQRTIRFLERIAVGGWRMKIYGISILGSEVPIGLEVAAVSAAKNVLPSPAQGEGRSGVGFVTVHAAPRRCYVLISWWAECNELHQQILSAPVGEGFSLAPHPTPAIGCVWELGVTDFERRAWIVDVLRPKEPLISRYLEREYNDVF